MHRSRRESTRKSFSDSDGARRIRPSESGARVRSFLWQGDSRVERPGYAYPEIMPDDEVSVRIQKYKEVLRNYCYYAESNMPRRKPREASKRHGDAVLPYIV